MQTQLEFEGWATGTVGTCCNRKPAIAASAAARSDRSFPPPRAREGPDTGATDPVDAEILAGCLRRIRCWRVPPNWSAHDWFGEMQSNSAAALWQAKCDYDPSRGVPLCAFERLRVIASAWTRYRQEWSYALHCPPQDGRAEPEPLPRDAPVLAPAIDPVREALRQVSEADRWLLEQLFWAELSESAIAQKLGVSQQAVSKRRSVVLGKLRDLLEDAEQAGRRGGGSVVIAVCLAKFVAWVMQEMYVRWL